jgi:hypothetical protein
MSGQEKSFGPVWHESWETVRPSHVVLLHVSPSKFRQPQQKRIKLVGRSMAGSGHVWARTAPEGTRARSATTDETSQHCR